MKITSRFLLGALLASQILPAQAQGITDELPNVTVSATRFEQPDVIIPAGITVISADDIAISGANSLSDVLRARGGIRITDLFGDGANASADLRGFGGAAGSNTLILVDGRRLNNTDIGSPDLSSVSLKDVERIEIIQGSAGALFGDQAVGGVINIITREPEKFTADISLESGSYGRAGLAARASDRVTEQLAYRVTAEALSTDNYRDNNQLDYNNVFARLDYRYGAGGIFLELQRVAEDSEQPGALRALDVAANRRQSLIDFQNDFEETQTTVARVGIKQSFSRHWQFAAEFTDRDSDTDFLTNFRGCEAIAFCLTAPDREERQQASFNPRLLGTYPTANGDILLTLGSDYIDSEYAIDSAFITRSNDQQIKSLYLQAVVPVSKQFSYTVGARRAEVENGLTDARVFPNGQQIDDDVTVASLGFVYEPAESWRLFARFDQNFRFAKVDEQAFTQPSVIGLRTQEGDSKELGASWQSGGHSVKLIVYQLDLENEIAFDPTVPSPFVFFNGANVNLDATVREGVILEGGYQANTRLRLSGSLALPRAKFESGIFNGNDVSGVADRVLTVASHYQLNQYWGVFAEIQDIGEQFLQGDNGNLLNKDNGYTTVNLNVDFSYERWTFSARINNLTDKEYAEAVNAFGAVNPSPERHFWIKVNYHFE